MRWKTGRRSSNIEDRRGRGRTMRRAGGLGGGAAVLALLATFIFGGDPTAIIGQMLGGGQGDQGQVVQQPAQRTPENDAAAEFVSVVLADTEDIWNGVFQKAGSRYQEPKLVLYNDMVQSACGGASSAAGPFYCPGDNKVYLDLDFLSELKRLGAPGDFAFAYVVAHEIGHHVQNLVGTSTEVRKRQARSSEIEGNQLSVRLELQADCYAGIWAHHAHQQRQILEAGDIEEGFAAAAAVGDDRLQKMSGRGVHPETFTHGSSEQRMQWFLKGLQSGDINQCNTFAGI